MGPGYPVLNYIGGTFPDIVVMDERNGLGTTKSPTTPGGLDRGVFEFRRSRGRERARGDGVSG